jgi:hypothetical protein
MLRVRGVARFRFSLRENSRFHFAVFADFAQGAKRVAELAASRVAVFPIERHILIDNPRGVFDVLDDFFKISDRDFERFHAKRQNIRFLSGCGGHFSRSFFRRSARKRKSNRADRFFSRRLSLAHNSRVQQESRRDVITKHSVFIRFALAFG